MKTLFPTWLQMASERLPSVTLKGSAGRTERFGMQLDIG
jgi:hypothetical protein